MPRRRRYATSDEPRGWPRTRDQCLVVVDLHDVPLASAYTTSKQALKTASTHLRLEMKPFGVEVTTLEPGAVATPLSEQREANAAQQWAAIPEPLRAQYRRHFKDSEALMERRFALHDPARFADEVYRNVISARKLKPYYVLGPGVAAMPWLHRLLPVQQVENLWASVFRARPSDAARRA